MKKKENQNNYIYVVLVKAMTGLGKFARLIGKYDYTHIAVCLDENFDKFYTFSRRKHYAPFDCGFMVETLDCYGFGKHNDVKLKIFKVPVLEEDKNKIEGYIDNISKDQNLRQKYAVILIVILTLELIALITIFTLKGLNILNYSDTTFNLFITGGIAEVFVLVRIIVKYLFKDNLTNALNIILENNNPIKHYTNNKYHKNKINSKEKEN